MPPAAAWRQIFRTAPLMQLFQGAEAVLELSKQPFAYERVTAPVLHVGGWHDYTNRHTLEAYARLAELGRTQRLVVGPWAHNGLLGGRTRVGEEEYGPSTRMTGDSVGRWTLEWLDAQLKGRALEGPPVRLFVMGENRWRAFDGWPPSQATARRWYLAPTARLADAPAGADTTSFSYDPGVSGGNFPEYDRNPNAGESGLGASVFRPVRIRLHTGRARPSRIEAFVLPPG